MEKRNMNAVTLVRVSTKKQGGEDRFGMEAQRSSNARIVAEKGLIVRRTVEYADVSGDAVMFTPEMQDLQVYLRTPEMKGGHLVAKELSRLLRPNFNSYPLLQVFVDQEITIDLPQYVLRLWTPEGRMLAGVMCANDFNEAERIRDRCMGGREEARKLGFCAAGAMTVPTGVTWDVKSKTWGYDKVYAPSIAEAFRMVATGETNFSYIIRKLDLRLRSRRGTPNLATPTSLRRLLANRLFIGERVWDEKFDLSIPKEKLMYVGRDNKLHKKTRPRIAREPDEIFVRQVITPGLVSPDVFEKVQVILRAKSDKVHQSHALHAGRSKFAYRGLLFCGECGQPLYTVGTQNPENGYYRCRDHFPQRGGTGQCNSPSMKRPKLDSELDRFFSREFSRSYFLGQILEKHYGSETRKNTVQRREGLIAQQRRLAEKRERVIEFALEGTITKADRDRRLASVDDSLDTIRKALAELAETPLPSHSEWRELLGPFRNFERLPPGEKRRLITARFQEIRIKDYRVVSLYLLTGDNVTPEPVRQVASDPSKCYSCGSRDKAAPTDDYCAQCAYGIEAEVATREMEREAARKTGEPIHPGVLDATIRYSGLNDTSHRL